MEMIQQTTSSCDRPIAYVNEVVLSEHNHGLEHAQQYRDPEHVDKLAVGSWLRRRLLGHPFEFDSQQGRPYRGQWVGYR